MPPLYKKNNPNNVIIIFISGKLRFNIAIINVMNNQNETHRRKQLKFERNFINIPFLAFALIIAILNLSFPDINIMMTLFGLFFLYNVYNVL